MKNKTLALIVLISLGVFIVFGAIAGAGYAYMVNKHGYIDYTITGDLLEYVSETQCALDGIETIDIETVSTDVVFSNSTDGLDADLRVSKFSSLKNLSLKTEVLRGTLYIEVIYPSISLYTGNSSLDISLPENFSGNIVVHSTSGNIKGEIPNGLSRLEIDTISGETNISFDTAEQVILSSSSGDFKAAGDITEKFYAETASGDISVQQIAEGCGEVFISTLSGEVAVDYSAACETNIDTASGNVRIHVPDEAPVNMIFSSVSGDMSGNVNIKSSGMRYKISTVSGDLSFN